MDFLDKVIFLDNLDQIKKFRLKTDSMYFDQDRVKEGISSIALRKVGELFLSLKCSGPRVVPLKLFYCESFTVLDLRFDNEQVLDKSPLSDKTLAMQVFSNCPLLEDLYMSNVSWKGLDVICFTLPRLKFFNIGGFGREGIENILDDSSVLPRSYHSFRNLVSFEVNVIYHGQIKSLFDTILQFSPNLTSLIFHQLFTYDKVGEDALPLNIVPHCLLLCLKEMEVAKLFLEIARVLQTITLGSASHQLEYLNKKKPTAKEVEDANDKVLEQLRAFSWASADCVVM
ncbi:hypothetical protein MKX01_033170 [Papaver californicum]|nr:hypothetical protein MKX01_033170 [Papaver californicum]